MFKNLQEVEALANQLIRHHKLAEIGWTFQWDRAKRRLGSCRHRNKLITLSEPLVSLILDNEWQIRDTILHEIAHGLVGPKHGHDAVWRAKAIEIGCNGERCYKTKIPIERRYVGTCPNGHKSLRHRAPSTQVSCAKCDKKFNPKYLINYVDTKMIKYFND